MAGQRLAGTEHLLAAILRDDTGVAVRLLTRLDGRPNDLLSDLSRVSGPTAPPAVAAKGAPKAGRTPTLWSIIAKGGEKRKKSNNFVKYLIIK